jgi:magnesium chelatase family protein
MARSELGESSADIRLRVIAARASAAKRFSDYGWRLNSQIPSRALRTVFQPQREAMNFLHDELDKEHITARGLHKIIRVSWTLADLRGHGIPTLDDVQKAHVLRGGSEL